MATLTGSVGGAFAANKSADVLYVQRLLNLHLPKLGHPVYVEELVMQSSANTRGRFTCYKENETPTSMKRSVTRLSESGLIDKETIAAIEAYQRHVMGKAKPDGKVDPGGKTLASMIDITLPRPTSHTVLGESDLVAAAKLLNCELAAIKAVAEVESRGDGFLPSGRPKILFERHKFHQHTGGAYDKEHPTISNSSFGGWINGERNYDRLLEAMACDREAGLKSASWGGFQIMGENFSAAGFGTVDSFVEAMYESEGRHLEAFVRFVQSQGLAPAIREKRWADFARGYNGPRYKDNDYDTAMEDAHNAHKAEEERREKLRPTSKCVLSNY